MTTENDAGRRVKVYIEPRDWWLGYYRSPDHHYVCPLPCVVIKWRRKNPEQPTIVLLDTEDMVVEDGVLYIEHKGVRMRLSDAAMFAAQTRVIPPGSSEADQ